MSKFFKVVLIVFGVLAAVIISLTIAFFVITKDAKLQESKLINYNQTVTFYDGDENEIVNSSVNGRKNAVVLNDLNDYTINAFIASEDRTFYKHNGLNYKRMVKALFKNITSRSFKEGASTISQQLIKNTHLTGDKTIYRKLNEIRLTARLESKYTKEQILEMYLNTIYFGHNCYGLGNAALFYFGEKAENLTLEQSATLVGLLTSPNNLSPFKNPEKCLNKRNIVLKSMSECGYINEAAYQNAAAAPLSAVYGNAGSGYDDYLSAVYDELDELGIDLYGLSDGGRVYTYMDENLQNKLQSINYEHDKSAIVTDLQTGGVKAYKSTINGAKRQPGSTIKPLLVYAPAIEEKILYPATKINDEKINYNGYSPENYDKKYRGYLSATDCVKYSLNVPAVKTLNALTVEKAANYAKKLNLTLEDEEKNLALALGGMKYGLTLKQLCDGYSAFPNGGKAQNANFIKKITDKNGNVLYSASKQEQEVYSKSTCSLINEMLIETAKSGTAKKLKDLPYEIAAKTGTCGNKNGNTDAYSICYTSQNCVGVWLGSANNEELDISGGGKCCEVAKEILDELYNNYSPPPLDTQSGTAEVYIDRQEYENSNSIVLADDICPKLNKIKIKCPQDNLPAQKSTKYSCPSIETPNILIDNNTVCIVLCQTQYYDYLVKRTNSKGETVTIYDGKWQNKIYDEVLSGSYSYSITPYFTENGNKHYGKEIILPSVYISQSENEELKLPDITQRDWFNE